jgi:hypothetical protein
MMFYWTTTQSSRIETRCCGCTPPRRPACAGSSSILLRGISEVYLLSIRLPLTFLRMIVHQSHVLIRYLGEHLRKALELAYLGFDRRTAVRMLCRSIESSRSILDVHNGTTGTNDGGRILCLTNNAPASGSWIALSDHLSIQYCNQPSSRLEFHCPGIRPDLSLLYFSLVSLQCAPLVLW